MNLTDVIVSDLPTASADPGADLGSLDDRCLLQLLDLLAERGYGFVTATPATHARFMRRWPGRKGQSARDVLGWSLPFDEGTLLPELLEALSAAGAVLRDPSGALKAAIRVSSVHGTLFLHSAYPTLDKDSVFLGPDSYRFADLIVRNLDGVPTGGRILDYGAGAGVGGIVAAMNVPDSRLVLADINPSALKLASVNARFAGVDHRTIEASDPAQVEGMFDLIVTHPPFMMDEASRSYRDGGDLFGGQLSLDWVLAGITKLKPDGRLVLHTGVSIVGGKDLLLERLQAHLAGGRFDWDYLELDPDIFSEDLDTPPYREVERIAAVGLLVKRIA